MTDEDTDPSAPIPLWIEKAVLKGLKAQEEAQAAREARMLASEARIIAALDGLGVARLALTQKATEVSVLVLQDESKALRLDLADLRSRLEHVEGVIRHPPTDRAPPPEGAE